MPIPTPNAAATRRAGVASVQRPKYTPTLITLLAYQQVRPHGEVFGKTAAWVHVVHGRWRTVVVADAVEGRTRLRSTGESLRVMER